MEAAILRAESRLSELEGLLNDPGFYIARASEAGSLMAELETTKKAVPALYARWEELSKIEAASAD